MLSVGAAGVGGFVGVARVGRDGVRHPFWRVAEGVNDAISIHAPQWGATCMSSTVAVAFTVKRYPDFGGRVSSPHTRPFPVDVYFNLKFRVHGSSLPREAIQW